MWYRYQKATGDFLLLGTGTSLLGTGTNRLLVIFCFGVPVSVCLVPVPIGYCIWVPVPLYVVPVPLLLQMLPLTVAFPGTSQQQLPSTTMIYIRSLDTNPYKNVHETRKTCISTKTRERSRAPILIQHERKI